MMPGSFKDANWMGLVQGMCVDFVNQGALDYLWSTHDARFTTVEAFDDVADIVALTHVLHMFV